MKKVPTLCAPSKVSCENGKVVEFYFPQILFEIVKMRRFQQAGGKSGKVFLSHFRLGGREIQGLFDLQCFAIFFSIFSILNHVPNLILS